jgi:hypothetical protein
VLLSPAQLSRHPQQVAAPSRAPEKILKLAPRHEVNKNKSSCPSTWQASYFCEKREKSVFRTLLWNDTREVVIWLSWQSLWLHATHPTRHKAISCHPWFRNEWGRSQILFL